MECPNHIQMKPKLVKKPEDKSRKAANSMPTKSINYESMGLLSTSIHKIFTSFGFTWVPLA